MRSSKLFFTLIILTASLIATKAQLKVLSNGNIDINDRELFIRDNANNTYGIGYAAYGSSQMTIFSDDLIDFRETDESTLAGQMSLNNRTLYRNGKIGIKTSPSIGDLEIGNINGYNASQTFIGAEFRIGRYNSSWGMGFVQARDNTTNPIGLRFRTQKSGGAVNDILHMFPDGDVYFYKPVYFQAGHNDISSDERMKTDIVNIEKSATAALYSLQGKEYDRGGKNDTITADSESRIREFGLIAQEVKEVYPELVSVNKDGYYSIKYTALIPIMIEALKEQKLEIEELKTGNSSQLKSTHINEAFSVDESATLKQKSLTASLYQNTPNPFSENTVIRYFLPKYVNDASIFIYNMQGKQIKNIPLHNRGESSETIFGSELQAGMYVYALIADGDIIDTKNMILTE
jgi:hypothetical protein